jgi:hypothetical protein
MKPKSLGLAVSLFAGAAACLVACADKSDDCHWLRTCGDSSSGGTGIGDAGTGGHGGNSANSVASGGVGFAGGATSTGGVTFAGGASSISSASATGGVTSTGGATSTGGVSATGGMAFTGGVSATGGMAFTGGVTSSGGVSFTGGVTSTGGAPTCTPTCQGATPICLESSLTCVECTEAAHCPGSKPVCKTERNADAGTDSAINTCVQCTHDEHCPGNMPICDASKNTCVECLNNADCTEASASLCLSGTCSHCAANADCSHIAGKNVCKTVPDSDAGTSSDDAGASAGTCVQCTGTDYGACGQSNGKNLVCDSLNNTCSSSTQHSAGLCQTCVSDAQCHAGELCAEQIFNGKPVGYYCFYIKGDTANGAPALCSSSRPYVQTTHTKSIDGQAADLCKLAVSTCPALNQYRSRDCAPSGTPDSSLCGFAPPGDAQCAVFDTGVYRCTVTCLSDDDCLSGVACNTGASPRVCNL